MSSSAPISRRHCLLACFTTLSALGLAACAAVPSATESQDALVQRFYQLVAAGDFDSCVLLISARSMSAEQLADFEPKLRHMLAGAKDKIDSKGGLRQVEVVERVLSEKDQVTKLRVLVTYRDGNTRRERINLFQESGVWKVQL